MLGMHACHCANDGVAPGQCLCAAVAAHRLAAHANPRLAASAALDRAPDRQHRRPLLPVTHACTHIVTHNSWSQAPGGKGKGREEGRPQGHKLADPEEGPDLGHLPPPQECVRSRLSTLQRVRICIRSTERRLTEAFVCAHLPRIAPQPSSSRAAPATRASPSPTRPASMPTLSLSTRSTPRRQ